MTKKECPKTLGKRIYLLFEKYGWVFVVLAFISGFIYFITPDNFNPETEVCIERTDLCIARNQEESEIFCECIEWRPKTFCELCIDDWTDECDAECQCDEYRDTDIIIGYIEDSGSCKEEPVRYCRISGVSQGEELNFTIKATEDACIVYFGDIYPHGEHINPYFEDMVYVELIEKNETQCELQIIYDKECTSAHQKNECEKGNPESTWDERWPSAEECIKAGYTTQADCGKWDYCRKKTIQDLNCAELMDYYENGRQCVGVFQPKCKYPLLREEGLYSKEEMRTTLLLQMIMKDCGGIA